MENLTTLNLNDTNVTDEGLHHLRELSSRVWLDVPDAVDKQGSAVKQLQMALPSCVNY
jgi:hypothetical protein